MAGNFSITENGACHWLARKAVCLRLYVPLRQVNRSQRRHVIMCYYERKFGMGFFPSPNIYVHLYIGQFPFWRVEIGRHFKNFIAHNFLRTCSKWERWGESLWHLLKSRRVWLLGLLDIHFYMLRSQSLVTKQRAEYYILVSGEWECYIS